MKKILLISLIFLVGCSKEDALEFPLEPSIEFKDIKFIETPDVAVMDTIKVSFNLRDGDFDLGINPTEIEPYHQKWYFLKSTKQKISSIKFKSGEFQANQLISIKEISLPLYDTFPPFETPYDCTTWEILKNSDKEIVDTIYFQFNQNFYNIFIEIYHQQPDLSWSLFNNNPLFAYPYCFAGFNGRFPILNSNTSSVDYWPFRIERISSKEIYFTYDIVSIGFNPLFKGKKIKLKIKVQDRALNKSNEIETFPIQF